MIEALRGKIIKISTSGIILDVAGVGYGLSLNPACLSSLPKINEELFLFVHTRVREDALELYGFLTLQEKEVFVLLINLNGVGPKLAMAILASLSLGDLKQAVEDRKVEWLTLVPGIGKRTAEKLLVELQGKLSSLELDLSEVKEKVSLAKNYSQTKIPADLKLEATVECSVLSKDLEKDLHSALLNLGLKLKDISQVIVDLKKDYHGEQLGPLIRRALLLLGSQQKKVQKSSYSLSKEKQRTSESNLDTLF